MGVFPKGTTSTFGYVILGQITKTKKKKKKKKGGKGGLKEKKKKGRGNRVGLYPNKNLLSEISLHFVRCLKMKHLAVEDVLNQLLRALSFKKKNRTKQFRVKDTLSFPHPV